MCPTLAPAQQQLTVQELNHLFAQVVLPNGRQEADVDLQAAQCCHHIGRGAPWVGCPGLHLLQGQALLIGQAVCMAITATGCQSRLRSGWTGRALGAATQSGQKAGSADWAREQNCVVAGHPCEGQGFGWGKRSAAARGCERRRGGWTVEQPVAQVSSRPTQTAGQAPGQ